MNAKLALDALKDLRDAVRFFWDDENSHIGELDSACRKADLALAEAVQVEPVADTLLGSHLDYTSRVLGHATPQQAASATAINAELVKELQNISDADPSKWVDGMQDQFQLWAQSRARWVIAKTTYEAAP